MLFMGKSTISMGHLYHSYVSLPEAIWGFQTTAKVQLHRANDAGGLQLLRQQQQRGGTWIHMMNKAEVDTLW